MATRPERGARAGKLRRTRRSRVLRSRRRRIGMDQEPFHRKNLRDSQRRRIACFHEKAHSSGFAVAARLRFACRAGLGWILVGKCTANSGMAETFRGRQGCAPARWRCRSASAKRACSRQTDRPKDEYRDTCTGIVAFCAQRISRRFPRGTNLILIQYAAETSMQIEEQMV